MPLWIPELAPGGEKPDPAFVGLYAIALEGPRKANKVYKIGMAAGRGGLRSRINSYHICPNSSGVGFYVYALLIAKPSPEPGETIRRVRLLEAALFESIKKANKEYYREDYRQATGAREFYSIPSKELKQFFEALQQKYPQWVEKVITQFDPIKGEVRRAGGAARRVEPEDFELSPDEIPLQRSEMTPEEIEMVFAEVKPAQTHSRRGRALKQTQKGLMSSLVQAQEKAEKTIGKQRKTAKKRIVKTE